MPLSDLAIRRLGKKKKTYRKWDADGLFIEVRPNGSKYLRMKFKFRGKWKTLALGVYPDVSLSAARNARDAARKLLASGIDPCEERKAAKSAAAASVPRLPTFKDTALEFIGSRKEKWTPYHSNYAKRRLEHNIFPTLGDKPIAQIEAPELLAAIRVIEARGATEMAHRTRELCSQVFRYGYAAGYCKGDPAHMIAQALKPHKAKGMAAVSMQGLPGLLRSIDGYGEVQTRLALQLMANVFLRTGELIAGEWCEVDFDRKLWEVPGSRMKMKVPHVVPLSRQSLAILGTLHELNGAYRWILPGRNPVRPISANTLIFAIYRMGFHSHQTVHGFRSIASTVLNDAVKPNGEKRFHSDWIEKQLAHGDRDPIRGAYNRAEYLPQRTRMMQWYSDFLDGVKGATF